MARIKENFEYLKPLSQQEKVKLAAKLKADFNQWDQDRQRQVDDARNIMIEVYMHNDNLKKDDWHANIRLNKLRAIKQAKKAAIWREIWSNPQQMFNVRGTNKETENNAKVQKAAIVESFEKMKIGKQYDDAIENCLDIGEMIFITDWEERSKVVRRKTKDGIVLQTVKRLFNMPSTGEQKTIELPYYENARVKSISPFMFVFDHNFYEHGNKKSWDSCIKIYKRFETYENIINNKDYELTDEQKEDLKNCCKGQSYVGNKKPDELRDEDIYGEKVEVLYCHGDFKVGDRLYKNYIAEVSAGKHLIRFEENPLFINPFVWCPIEIDPETGRGIPQLKSAYYLCKEMEKMVNASIDMQQLAINPPVWANEDLIDKEKKDINIYPGAILKYKNNYDGSLPTALTLGYNNNLMSLIEGLDKQVSDNTNVNSNMFGNITSSKRSATELSLVDKGASATIAKELDIINQDLTIPTVENVAELLAMFKQGDDYIYVEEKGHNLVYRITNEIRQAQYNYVYEDRNAINDRKSKFNELYQLFMGVAQDPELRQIISWRDVIETGVEMIGFDNSDKFFVPENKLSQIFSKLKQMPAQMQEAFADMLEAQSSNYQASASQQSLRTPPSPLMAGAGRLNTDEMDGAADALQASEQEVRRLPD